jgi:DHA1 family bicyclomycin/chloramphenicol resistance-like MFS transporter
MADDRNRSHQGLNKPKKNKTVDQKTPDDHLTSEQPARPKGSSLHLLALLTAATAIGPLSINVIVPALPGMARAFAADTAVVQLTVSAYLFVLAFSQLLLGPLSDRFGRRPVMLAGLGVAGVSCIIAAFAPNIESLIGARVLQAVGASSGMVMGRAIIRDLYSRDRAASMIGWVTMTVVVVPLFGPLVGGILESAFGWWVSRRGPR